MDAMPMPLKTFRPALDQDDIADHWATRLRNELLAQITFLRTVPDQTLVCVQDAIEKLEYVLADTNACVAAGLMDQPFGPDRDDIERASKLLTEMVAKPAPVALAAE
jgi:hypothetical protein